MHASHIRLALPLCLVTSAFGASAQLDPFVTPFGTTLKDVSDASAADLNGDGVLDIVACSSSTNFVGAIAWFEGLGGGQFGPARFLEQQGLQHLQVEAADIDLDGDVDVITRGALSGLGWCENLGGGSFATRTDLSTTGASLSGLSFELADIDGDGDLDAILNRFFDVVLLRNDGTAAFTASTIVSSGSDRIVDFHVSDMTADGRLDIVLATYFDFDILVGGGVAVSAQLPGGTFEPYQRSVTALAGSPRVCAVDVDGDGDRDVAVVESDVDQLRSLENLGGGTFQWNPSSLLALPSIIDLVPVDQDGDGDEDLLLTAQGTPNDWRVQWATANGAAGLSLGSTVETGFSFTGAMAADLWGVGAADVVTWSASFDRLAVHERFANGSYGAARVLTARFFVDKSVWSDLNGDGLLDFIALENESTDDFLAYSLQLPSGAFGPVGTQPVSGVFYSEPTAADLDGDGIDEIVFAESSGQGGTSEEVLMCRAVAGALGAPAVISTIAGSPGFSTPYPYDLNGDGDLDLVMGSFAAPGTVFAIDNLGGLTFGAPRPLINGPEGSLIPPVDLDGDGNLDLVAYSSFQSSNTQVVAYRSLGNGTFSAGVTIGSETRGTPDLLAFDVDGDGDNDLVRRHSLNAAFGSEILWYENLGSFSFGAAQFLAPGQTVDFRSGLRAADWDLDGRVDLVRMNHTGSGAELLRNLGGGAFSSPMSLANDVDDAGDFEVLDVDGDLDPDLYVADDGALQYRLYRNGSELGSIFCTGVANSTGTPGGLRVTGSSFAELDALGLTASNLPPGLLGIFIVSRQARPPVAIPQSQGLLCLGGSIGRYIRPGEFGLADSSGQLSRTVSILSSPIPTGGASAVAGETWRFQCWHRDLAPTPTSNLTEAVEVTWQ